MIKVLVVGQTPPPIHGQAVMIETLLRGKYQNVQLFHIKLAFSRDVEEVGRFQPSKVIHLIRVVMSIILYRFRYGINVLYYPPAGPHRIAVFRDLAILLATRWLFRNTVLHFHASGISELYPQLNFFVRFLFRKAFFFPDVAIRLSPLTPEDGQALHAKKEYIVPYGIEDVYEKYQCAKTVPACILYAGMLHESKGILVLLEACNLLLKKNLDFILALMGKFTSAHFERQAHSVVQRYGLGSRVQFLGVLTGSRKYEAYSRATIFCFPTYYESEAFGVVLIEAMQFGLPVVASRWRGVSSAVEEFTNGYLVEAKNSGELAERLELLLRNPSEAERMGKKGREMFLKNYTVDRYHQRMEEVFATLAREEK